MQKKLQWNAIGMQKHITHMMNKLLDKRDALPRDHTVAFRRLQRFIDKIVDIHTTIGQIDDLLIPRLEEALRVKFKTPELVYLALSRPSIRHILEQVEVEFNDDPTFNINEDTMKELKSAGDAGNVLALIGDSALDLAVIQVLWDTSLATVGDLTQKRVDIVSNESLSRFCDEFLLYDFRLWNVEKESNLSTTNKTLQHEKGTLVEAIVGVVYLETGLEAIERIVPLLQ